MKKGLVLSVVCGLLFACGGGGGSGGGETITPVPVPAPTPTPSPTPEARLTADLIKTATQCDAVQADTDAQFVVHSADGSILATHVPDAEGKIDIVWPEEAQHVSIVATVGESGGYRISSIIDVTEGDLGIRKEYDSRLDANCSCQDLLLELSDVNSAYPNHTVFIGGGLQQGSIHPMRWCTVPDQSFPMVDILLLPTSDDQNAFATLLQIEAAQSNYTLVADDFAADANAGFEAVIATNATDIARYRTYANTAAGRQFMISGEARQFVFPGQSSNNFVQAYREVAMGSNEQGSVNYEAIRRIKVDTNSATQTLTIAENEDALLAAIAGLSDAFAEGTSVDYDLSSLGSQRTVAYGTLFGTDYQWRLDAPIAGTLPALRLPAAVEADLASRSSTDMYIGVSGYLQNGGRAEFRRQLATESRSGSKVRPAYFDNYDAEQLRIVFE